LNPKNIRGPSFFERNVGVLLQSTIGIAQPLFDILGKNYDYFMGWDISNWGILTVAVIIYSFPPAVLILCREMLAKLNSSSARVFEYVVLSLLSSAFLLQVSKNFGYDNHVWVSVFLIMVGFYASTHVLRSRLLSNNAKIISSITLIFPLIFLIGYYTAYSSKNVEPNELIEPPMLNSSATPVVTIVFDELPTVTLLGENGEIDSERYQNFYDFARESVWYRNAVTTAPNTKNAVPTILSGLVKPFGTLPNVDNYPLNLFTVLQHSHGINAVYSEHTDLCPDELLNRKSIPLKKKFIGMILDTGLIYLQITLPKTISIYLRPVTMKSHDYFNIIKMGVHSDQRINLHNEFIRLINLYSGSRPPLFFFHSLFPHVSWYFKPNGNMYYTFSEAWKMPGIDYIEDVWTDSEWTVTQAWRRHILQTMYTDRQFGEVIEALKEKQIYDSALIIVTADHGVSFWPGEGRRQVLHNPRSDIYGIPLFIKYPNSKVKGVDTRKVSIADILPTILDVIGDKGDRRFDGQSLINDETADVPYDDDFPGLDFERSLNRKIELFGDGDLISLYKAGPHGKLVGNSIPNSQITDSSDYSFGVHQLHAYQDIDTSSNYIPSRISGEIYNGSSGAEDSPVQLAVSINGIISAVTETRHGISHQEFDFLVPDDVLRHGTNQITFYLIPDSTQTQFHLIKHGASKKGENKVDADTAFMNSLKRIYRKITRWFIS